MRGGLEWTQGRKEVGGEAARDRKRRKRKRRRGIRTSFPGGKNAIKGQVGEREEKKKGLEARQKHAQSELQLPCAGSSELQSVLSTPNNKKRRQRYQEAAERGTITNAAVAIVGTDISPRKKRGQHRAE